MIRYNWDSPIVEIVPDFAPFLFDSPWVTRHVTLRDLLTHQTGVVRSYDELWIANVVNRSNIVE